jgi:hypothetical protein
MVAPGAPRYQMDQPGEQDDLVPLVGTRRRFGGEHFSPYRDDPVREITDRKLAGIQNRSAMVCDVTDSDSLCLSLASSFLLQFTSTFQKRARKKSREAGAAVAAFRVCGHVAVHHMSCKTRKDRTVCTIETISMILLGLARWELRKNMGFG